MAEDQKRKKVLFIEDDAALQTIIKQKLAESEIDCLLASNGQKGLALAKEIPNLILLDIMLPGGVNGFDILEQLKAKEELKKIPVIILTNLEGEQKTALSIGAVDYIVKANISLDEVILKVKNHLS